MAAQSQEGSQSTVCSSNEAYLYNLTGCPPKKRFRQQASDRFHEMPCLPAKKRVQAFQFAEDLLLLAECLDHEPDQKQKKSVNVTTSTTSTMPPPSPPQTTSAIPQPPPQTTRTVKNVAASSKKICRFCQEGGDSKEAGVLMEHRKESLTEEHSSDDSSDSTYVHSRCAEWAPNVYFNSKGKVRNLEAEIARAHKLKCHSCGVKGAALGCFSIRCRKTFHYTCAQNIPDCRWSETKYLLLCPEHASAGFKNQRVR